MMSFVSNAVIRLFELAEEHADENIRQWFLMNSPYAPITIAIIYYLTVCHIGPKLMQNRKPFNISNVILAYNFYQIIINGYLCAQFIYFTSCQPPPLLCYRWKYPTSPDYTLITWLQYIYFISRLTDLFDTVFFVLRKKQTHVTFLHVYHHTLVLLGAWFCAGYIHGGIVIFFGICNTFVHSVMYLYYFLAATSFGKGIASYLKRPLTQLQLIQFFLCGLHFLYSLHDAECVDYHIYVIYLGESQLVLMILLFLRFYRRTYVKEKNLVNQQQRESQHQNGVAAAKIKST